MPAASASLPDSGRPYRRERHCKHADVEPHSSMPVLPQLTILRNSVLIDKAQIGFRLLSGVPSRVFRRGRQRRETNDFRRLHPDIEILKSLCNQAQTWRSCWSKRISAARSPKRSPHSSSCSSNAPVSASVQPARRGQSHRSLAPSSVREEKAGLVLVTGLPRNIQAAVGGRRRRNRAQPYAIRE